MKKLILFMLCPLWRPFPRWFRRGLRVTFEHNIHMLNWYFPLYINLLWSWDTNWIFSVCIVTQWKIKMQTIQYRRSRIREMKEDKYTKSLAKNQVCAIFQRRDIRKNGLPKFIKLLSWKRHVGVPFRDTNMAAGYQQKHLFSSFPTNAWILRLRNS